MYGSSDKNFVKYFSVSHAPVLKLKPSAFCRSALKIFKTDDVELPWLHTLRTKVINIFGNYLIFNHFRSYIFLRVCVATSFYGIPIS